MSPDVEKGQAVLRALDEAKLVVRSAFWLSLPEASEWRLVLAMPLVDEKGPRAGYQAVQKAVTSRAGELPIPLSHISVVGLGDRVYRALRRAVKTTRGAIAGIRVTGNVIDKVLVEDAYIYRSS